MATVKHEFKVSDGNYGNRTKSIALDIKAEHLQKAMELLDAWELFEREMMSIMSEHGRSDMDELPAKVYKRYEQLEQARNDVIGELAEIAESAELMNVKKTDDKEE